MSYEFLEIGAGLSVLSTTFVAVATIGTFYYQKYIKPKKIEKEFQWKFGNGEKEFSRWDLIRLRKGLNEAWRSTPYIEVYKKVLDGRLAPYIESEMKGAYWTPETRPEDISETYAETSPHARR